jgi:hypothetical protein
MLLLTLNTFNVNQDQNIIDLAKQKQTEYHTPNKHYVVIVDYSKPIDDIRLFVVDMTTNTVALRSTVAHGVASGGPLPTNFSNQINSRKSSLGAYQTKGTYIGGFGYSMIIKGLDPTNNNAEKRAIIFHSSKIMKSKYSWGCFATPDSVNRKLIDMIKNGCLVYVKR